MSLTMGSVTVLAVGSTTDSLSTAAPSSGTGPYTYQWYVAGSSAFTPGSTNIITGATSTSLSQSGLTPSTTYYYKVVATDSASTPALGTSAAVQVVTAAAQPSPNQFSQAPFLGMLDQHFNGDTIAVKFDPAGSGTLTAGQAVKFSTNSTQIGTNNGIPLIVPCTAQTDVACGFVNYNIKNASFVPGNSLEISMFGNVMYLQAIDQVDRGEFVTLDAYPAVQIGGVTPGTGSSGFAIVGWSLDTAAAGTLCRVFLQTPAAPYAVD